MAYTPQNRLQADGKAQGALAHRRCPAPLSEDGFLIHGINLTAAKSNAPQNRHATGKQPSHIQVEHQEL